MVNLAGPSMPNLMFRALIFKTSVSPLSKILAMQSVGVVQLASCKKGKCTCSAS